MYLIEQKGYIPATLPVFEMRNSNQSYGSAGQIANLILMNAPNSRAMIDDQTKPNRCETTLQSWIGGLFSSPMTSVTNSLLSFNSFKMI